MFPVSRPTLEWWRPVHVAPETHFADPSARVLDEHRDSPLAFTMLMAFTLILLLAPQSFFPFLGVLRIAMLSAMMALLSHTITRFVQRRPLIVVTRELIYAASLVLWALLSIPFSYWPGGSLLFVFDLYLKSVLVFLLLSQVVNTLERLKQVAWVLSFVAIPVALSGLQHFLTGNFLLLDNVSSEEKRIVGFDAPLTQNPNDLALMLNLILPLTVALFSISKSRSLRLILLCCISLDVATIIATFSRGGFITLAVTLVMSLWGLWRRQQKRATALLLFSLLVVAPFLPSSYVDRLSTITDINADPTGSAQTRWADTQSALQYISRHPLVGAGVGMNYLGLNEIRGSGWQGIHNVYLEYTIELGIPGLLLFLLLLGGCIRSMSAVQRQSVFSGDLYFLAEGIRISLIAFAVAALFHPVAYHFYFYYIAGLALAAVLISRSNSKASC